jgi:hypothetical protein
MNRFLVGMLLALLLTGCVHNRRFSASLTRQQFLKQHENINDGKPLCYDQFKEIYEEEYILNYNDCSNKSSKYARILRENGYEADLLIIYNTKYSHCVVIVKGENGLHYYDVTNNTWGVKSVLSKEWTHLHVVPFEDRFKRGHNGFDERNVKKGEAQKR